LAVVVVCSGLDVVNAIPCVVIIDVKFDVSSLGNGEVMFMLMAVELVVVSLIADEKQYRKLRFLVS
jgi:hypothetical protein